MIHYDVCVIKEENTSNKAKTKNHVLIHCIVVTVLQYQPTKNK